MDTTTFMLAQKLDRDIKRKQGIVKSLETREEAIGIDIVTKDFPNGQRIEYKEDKKLALIISDMILASLLRDIEELTIQFDNI